MTAIASSLCCITPILALVSGTSGFVSTFSWMEPFRPFLISFTILVLTYAWYQKLKTQKSIDCEQNNKAPFMQTKLFLTIVIVFTLVMTAFPYFLLEFYAKINKTEIIVNPSNIQKIKLSIKGMTCSSCEISY